MTHSSYSAYEFIHLGDWKLGCLVIWGSGLISPILRALKGETYIACDYECDEISTGGGRSDQFFGGDLMSSPLGLDAVFSRAFHFPNHGTMTSLPFPGLNDPPTSFPRLPKQ